MAQVDFAKRGIDIGSLSLNLPNMMKQKEEAVKQLTSGIGILFNKNKVAFLLCTDSFLSSPPSVSKLDSSLLKELNLQKWSSFEIILPPPFDNVYVHVHAERWLTYTYTHMHKHTFAIKFNHSLSLPTFSRLPTSVVMVPSHLPTRWQWPRLMAPRSSLRPGTSS